LALLIAAPMQIQWHDSQLTIAFGHIPAAPAPQTVAITPPAVAPAAAAQPIDYDRIISEVAKSQQAWVLTELKKRDAEQVKWIGRLQGQYNYLESNQRSIERENLENATAIGRLASGAQD
jgi:hypothetical protein